LFAVQSVEQLGRKASKD